MPTQPKIKINDNKDLRLQIDKLYDKTDQITLAKWAIACAKHILYLSEIEEIDLTDLKNGIEVNERWQQGNATVHDVRQAGFKIHAVARNCKSEIAKNAVRAMGQAVAVGHMKEHAMVCSDYAIKTVQVASPNAHDKITMERRWQLNTLCELSGSSDEEFTMS